MPNLIKFCFICDSVKGIKKELYFEFLEKILRLKHLQEIIINIEKESEYYSLNELKNMFSKVNLSKFKKIDIKKWKQQRIMNVIYSYFDYILGFIYYLFGIIIQYILGIINEN